MTNPARSHTLTVDSAGLLLIPPELWAGSIFEEFDRFDICTNDDGSVLFRPCPLVKDATGSYPAPGHLGIGPLDHCGLTKFSCANAACGRSAIVEHEDRFPDRWIQVIVMRSDLCWESTASFCSKACAGAHLVADAALAPARPEGLANHVCS